jgi:hypothetical protein
LPNETTNAKLERLYADWHRESAPIISSHTDAFVRLPSYRKLVAVGKPALPFLERKMAEGQGIDFMLVFAVVEICGWDMPFPGGSVQNYRDQVLQKLRQR